MGLGDGIGEGEGLGREMGLGIETGCEERWVGGWRWVCGGRWAWGGRRFGQGNGFGVALDLGREMGREGDVLGEMSLGVGEALGRKMGWVMAMGWLREMACSTPDLHLGSC